jgi:hypothetical protein
MQIYTPEEILEQVKALTGDRFDSDLASRLGVSKQSLPQYKHKSVVDLQQRIICLLLKEIKSRSE